MTSDIIYSLSGQVLSSSKYIPLKIITSTIASVATTAETFTPPNKLSAFNSVKNTFFDAKGVLRAKVSSVSYKQFSIIANCQYDESGVSVNAAKCKLKNNYFNQADYIGVDCADLTGECDPSFGLFCQSFTNGTKSCM